MLLKYFEEDEDDMDDMDMFVDADDPDVEVGDYILSAL
jgi:hypothetical protein